MKLKYQLLLLALLSLLFPITGWLALKSVDKEFRLTIEQASQNTLSSLVASVQQILQSDSSLELNGLIPAVIENFVADGDSGEWNTVIDYQYTSETDTLQVKMALDQNYLYLLLASNDATISSSSLDSSKNDQVIIAVADDRGLYKYTFQRQAEGLVFKSDKSNEKPEYQAYWHEISVGYVLEVRIKSNDIHHVGFASVNKSLMPNLTTGTLDTARTLKLLPIVSKNQSFQSTIENITPENNHFSLIDSQNRVIYQSDKLPNNQQVSQWQWIITPIYQWLFDIDSNAADNKWFYRQADGMAGIKHSIKLDGIRYELKSMMPQGQQSMIQTLLKAGVMMIAVVLLLMLAYLGYSLFLAWRIKKLNRALQTVLDDSGRMNIQMPSHRAGDEIGQLSRGIESMLMEMREYTQYLKDLGSRLSHEMKTPLAIVQSSLDNLEMENDPDFIKRAQGGTKRLRFILNQLSELTQLKYTLEQTPKENFDLSELVQQLAKSYQSFIPNLKTKIDPNCLVINGSKDLIAQMMDKLMDNAKDYIAEDGYIQISVSAIGNKAVLQIFNTDSQLPEKGLNIFDSLVSIRKKQDKQTTHLGLGLYLVQLICRYHQAELKAENTIKPKGVVFSIEFNQSATI